MTRCLDYIEKHEFVNNKEITSLIKAEWQTVRTNQLGLLENTAKSLFSERCCGALFFGDQVVASNGHWLIHANTDGPSMDYNVSHFFYDYITDEVRENYNPFTKEGVYVVDLFDLICCPQQYQFKLRAVDIVDCSEQLVPTIRARRNTTFEAQPKTGTSALEFILTTRKEVISDIIPLPVPVYSPFPSFSVNLSYFCKMMAVATNYADTVFVETADVGSPLYIRLPAMTFVLGQYLRRMV